MERLEDYPDAQFGPIQQRIYDAVDLRKGASPQEFVDSLPTGTVWQTDHDHELRAVLVRWREPLVLVF